ncbi:phosphotransferase enzyme family protein [Histoplasma capsulatum G186AR]|uniref:Phosphotransferase enzyme family protein n=2 Tax=Ajellomyces capsulatus TaxID=5037 RepID=C0NLR2_AJECG|nr:phosphotransferase enzyme family protein [Histoplasma capsulatum G186AR]EEH07563.1 phosphotransferase enzyme family protein [Histoplasma capsulatum G186AR]
MSAGRSLACYSPLSSLSPDHEFFRYTRDRFIQNEAHEMAQRYIHFDVKELAHVGAAAVGAKSCLNIEKYLDGMYNKAFLLTLDNGMQAVAKIPNPNAGLPHLTTASEVATMEFVRSVCKTPVPQVYSWNSRPNSVGAEYIIMEKVPGVPLDSVWPRMEIGDRLEVVKTIARYQEEWMSISFDHFGGLYFTQDLDGIRHQNMSYEKGGVTLLDERFAIGPSTGRERVDHGRSTVQFDRGPWSTVVEYLTAIGRQEITCVKALPNLPKSPIALYGPGTYRPTRARKLKALELYLTMIKYLCPVDRSITSSCLWHDDLHGENIFVDPKSPTEIVGIIDWQSTELAPLFHHARQPHLLDYDGPQLHGLERPKLPEDLLKLNIEAQKEAKALYNKQALSSLYRTFVYKRNPRLHRVLEYRESPNFDLLLLARNLLIDGEAIYLARIVELEGTWADPPGVVTSERKDCPYPFYFSDEEKAEIKRDMNGSLLGMQAMQCIKDSLGDLFPEQGIVRPEQYEEAKDALCQAKEFIIREFARNKNEEKAWEEEWPFSS